MLELPLLSAAALGVGVLVGLTGVGAGAVMTPLLIAGFGVAAPVAIGTDLACAAVAKTAGTVAHRAARNVVVRIVIALAAGSVPAALMAFVVIARFDHDAAALAHVMRTGVAFVLLASIAVILLRGPLMRLRRRRAEASSPSSHALRLAATVAVGGAMGFTVALTSLGAGAIGAACIALLYPEMDPAEIAGSDIAHAVPLTTIAAAGHAWLGTIDVALLLALLLGAIPGIVSGSLLARSFPAGALRVLLLAVLAFATFKLLS